MSKTLSEFYARTVATYINGERLTYADIIKMVILVFQ